MSAAALLGIGAAFLGMVFALAVWGVFRMAGAARPLRRGNPTPMDLSPPGGPIAGLWRPRPAGSRPRAPHRTGLLRRSRHALWRD